MPLPRNLYHGIRVRLRRRRDDRSPPIINHYSGFGIGSEFKYSGTIPVLREVQPTPNGFLNSQRGYSNLAGNRRSVPSPGRNHFKASTLIQNPEDTRVRASGLQALRVLVRLTTWTRFLADLLQVILGQPLNGAYNH